MAHHTSITDFNRSHPLQVRLWGGKAIILWAIFICPLSSFAQSGALDLSFGTNGKVITAIGNADDAAYAVVIQTDGKIVAAGYSSNSSYYDFALIRYNTDGTLDTTFGTNGKVTTNFGGWGSCISSAAIQSDGKIVAVGYYGQSGYTYIAIARYNPNGSLDSSFDGDGKVIDSIGVYSSDRAQSIAIQCDGKFVAGGWTDTG